MTITRIGTDAPSATPNNQTNLSLALTHGSTPQVNDIVIIEAALLAPGTGTINDFDLPDGWTLVGTAFDAGSTSIRMSVFEKKWVSGDTLPTLTWPLAAQAVAIVKIRRGVNGATPVLQSSAAVHAGTSSARTTGTITTTEDSVIEYAFADRSGSTFTKGTSTDDSLATSLLTSSLSLASFAVPSVSPAGAYARTATATANTSIGASAIYALKPASGTAPTVSVGADFTVNSDTNDHFALTATASDPDGTIASYLWEDITGTPVTLPGTTATITVLVTKPNAGEVRTYRCTVTDNDGLTANDSVAVTITATTPSSSSITRVGTDNTCANPNTLTNTSLALTHGSTPAINDTVIVEAVLLAVGTGTSNDFTTPTGWTLVGTAFDAGTPSIRLSVFEKKWASGDTLPTLTWPNASQAVAVVKIRRGVDLTTPVPQASVVVHAGTSTARTSGTITTTQDGVIEYAFADRSGSTFTKGTGTDDSLASVLLSTSASLASFAVPGVSVAGTYTKTATATANTSVGASAIYELKPGSGVPPTVSAGGDATVDPNVDDTFTITATASDADGTIASYLWEDITSTPTTVVGSGASRTINVPRSVTGTTKTYLCTVTDNSGLTSNDSVVITVLPHTRWRKTASGLQATRRYSAS